MAETSVKTISDREQIIEILSDGNRKVPFGQTKLLIVGREQDGKEEFINSLIPSKELATGETHWKETIIRGHFDAKTFTRVEVSKKPTIETPRFVLWDYTWKNEFSFLEHLFLTQRTVYVVLFDARCFLKDEEKDVVRDYLHLFLGSKRIQGRKSVTILVGTNCNDLSADDISSVNSQIQSKILIGNDFNVVFNTTSSFFPFDASSGLNQDVVKKLITKTILERQHIKEELPESLMKFYIDFMNTGEEGYIHRKNIKTLFMKRGVINIKQIDLTLQLMHMQGLITYYHAQEELAQYIVYRPEFFLQAFGVIMYKDGGTFTPTFDDSFGSMFVNFRINRILEAKFIDNVWENIGLKDDAVKSYLKRLMLYTNMVADYNFDNVDSFLVPIFDPVMDANPDKIKEENFNGPRFVIDFTGTSSATFNRTYVRYLPYGFFEKLVSTAIQLSSSFKNVVMPIISHQRAQISFGGKLFFLLKLIRDPKGNMDWIECKMLSKATWSEATKILQRIYGMVNGIKQDFYSGPDFEVASTILICSSKATNYQLAPLERVKENENSEENPIQLAGKGIDFLSYKDFAHWSGTDENDKFEPFDINQSFEFNPPQEVEKELPKGFDFHCFLSYNERTASVEIDKQYELLTRLGYKCFLDSKLSGKKTHKFYTDRLARSMIYVLLLSKDVFKNKLIIKEINIAREEEKDIVFLSHPNTGKMGYLRFSEYEENAPHEMKYLFSKYKAYPLQKRFYLQEAVTNRLKAQINTSLAKFKA